MTDFEVVLKFIQEIQNPKDKTEELFIIDAVLREVSEERLKQILQMFAVFMPQWIDPSVDLKTEYWLEVPQ